MLKLKSVNLQIKNLIKLRDDEPFDIFKFEHELFKFLKQHEEKAMVPLMAVLEDDFDFPEAMSSIIHGIEHAIGREYVDEMMEGLHELLPNAPHWASILVIRTLNSPKDAQLVEECLANTKQEYKNSWKKNLLSINEDMPEFDTKTAPLLNALA